MLTIGIMVLCFNHQPSATALWLDWCAGGWAALVGDSNWNIPLIDKEKSLGAPANGVSRIQREPHSIPKPTPPFLLRPIYLSASTINGA